MIQQQCLQSSMNQMLITYFTGLMTRSYPWIPKFYDKQALVQVFLPNYLVLLDMYAYYRILYKAQVLYNMLHTILLQVL